MSTVANKQVTTIDDLKAAPILKALDSGPQWVVYSKDKVPYSPKAPYGAEADNSDTWVTLTEAFDFWRANSHKYIGIGRELIKEQLITVIDLDHCIDKNGNLSDYARYVVALFNSYTEVSPGGDGLHIWVYGSIPKNWADDPHKEYSPTSPIEMYDCKKYFTVTGKHYPGTPLTKPHHNPVYTCDSDLLDKNR